MLPEKKTNTNIGIGLGILLQVAGQGLSYANEALVLPALVMTLLGAVFFIWGCMNYAEGKGHSKWLGLLGLLSCIGLVILVILPDHHKQTR